MALPNPPQGLQGGSCCPCVDNAVIHKTSRKEGWMCPGRLERRFSTSALPPTPHNSKPSSPVCTGQVPCPHEFVCAPERRKDIEGVIGEAFRRVEKEHIEACCRHQGRNVTSCVAGIPRLQRCHLDLRRWEVERRARDRGTNPLQSMKHNRVRRGGLLTPGVCKSELPFVQA